MNAEMMLVSVIERKNRALHRVRQIVDPSISAIQIRRGDARHPRPAYCVLVIYQPSTFPSDILRLVNELNRQRINIILVANAVPSGIEEKLVGNCHSFIRRKNHGYDFGAYKTGIEFALTLSPKRLIVLNDSVHFFEGDNLSKYISRLSEGDHPFIGATESYEIRHHIQSYCYSFGEEILASGAFKKFWDAYAPMNDRRYTVLNGEVALTQFLSTAGFYPSVLFRASDLRGHLSSSDTQEIISAAELLPSNIRSARTSHIKGWLTNENDKYDFMKGVRKQQAISEICRSVFDGNQVGLGAFLFAKYLGMPFIKKNLAKYGYFTHSDIITGLRSARLVVDGHAEHVLKLFKRQSSRAPTKWEQFNQRHMFS